MWWLPRVPREASGCGRVLLPACRCLTRLYSEDVSTGLSPDFLLQVKVGNHTAEGTGTNKKVAKRNAAENMLEILGFKVPQAQPTKPALKSEEKVTAQGSVSLLSNGKMTSSPHPRGLWPPPGPSFRARLHPPGRKTAPSAASQPFGALARGQKGRCMSVAPSVVLG